MDIDFAEYAIWKGIEKVAAEQKKTPLVDRLAKRRFKRPLGSAIGTTLGGAILGGVLGHSTLERMHSPTPTPDDRLKRILTGAALGGAALTGLDSIGRPAYEKGYADWLDRRATKQGVDLTSPEEKQRLMRQLYLEDEYTKTAPGLFAAATGGGLALDSIAAGRKPSKKILLLASGLGALGEGAGALKRRAIKKRYEKEFGKMD